MIVIYTPKVTHRIRYTLDFAFNNYFGVPYELTEDPYKPSGDNIFISYAGDKPEGYYHIYRSGLLNETTISPQQIFVSREIPVNTSDTDETGDESTGMPVFFQTTDHFDLKYDIFSCIFYLLSRYEEYLPHDKDEHGRYKPSNSILSMPVFNFSPIVEIWLTDLKNRLRRINPAILFKEHKFEYQPTVDIDNAFKYIGRNWLKKPPNIFNKECWLVLSQKIRDPYDTTDFIVNELKKNAASPVFFYLLSDESEKDSRVAPRSTQLASLIRSHAGIETGIHPSYNAFQETKILAEKELLEQITTTVITRARQHFLRISFPDYYRNLIKTGIKDDFSLGYPDVTGFRSGYSRPFSFFDLENDLDTSLTLHPSCWMDATYEYYQTKNIEEIRQDFLLFLERLKKINAKLVTIFHNDLIATEKFRSVFVFINHHVNSGI